MSIAGRNQVGKYESEARRSRLSPRWLSWRVLAGVVPLHTAFGHDAIDVDADLFPWIHWQDLQQCPLLLHWVGYSPGQGLDRCSLSF